MPEHLRALVVVLAAGFSVFWFSKKPATESGVLSPPAFGQLRNAWFGATVLAFLAHNFWVYIFLAGAFLHFHRRRTANVLALYCICLFVLPPFEAEIPGIGPIEHFFTITHYRLLSLVLLLPAAIAIATSPDRVFKRSNAIDFFVLTLIVWQCLVTLANVSMTESLRGGFYLLLDIWLPYYVASRALRNIEDFRQVALAAAIAGMIVAILAPFETLRHWLLYESLRNPLGFPGAGLYLARGDDGPLRANVSVGNSIVLGYTIAWCACMYAIVVPSLRADWRRLAGWLVLIAGLIAAFSRGPWVGAAVMIIVMMGIGPGAGKRIAWSTLLGTAGLFALLLSPFGDSVVAYLPFVGTVDAHNVDYRSRLLDVSLEVLAQNPMVGDFGYLQNPLMEQMRQGQGIIDMVNAYLEVVMPFGLIGLSLFLGALFAALIKTFRTHSRAKFRDKDAEILGRVLLAALIGVMVIIATVSSIGVIPVLYWLLIGLCGCYARIYSMSGKGRMPAALDPAPEQSTAQPHRRPGRRMSSRNHPL